MGPPSAAEDSSGVPRAGVDQLKTSPARKWRARGRIEHTLLVGVNGLRPNRPKTFARYLTIPQKVTTVSIYGKGPGHPEGYPGPGAVLLVFVYGPPDQLMLCGFQVFPL